MVEGDGEGSGAGVPPCWLASSGCLVAAAVMTVRMVAAGR